MTPTPASFPRKQGWMSIWKLNFSKKTQGSHSFEKALNFEGCLEKALNYMAGPEKPLNLLWTALNFCIEGPKFIFESIWSDKS